MRSYQITLALVLGAMLATPMASHAASGTEYQAQRSSVTLASLNANEPLAKQFPAIPGKIIEVEGTVNGIFSRDKGAGFLLQVNPDQTLVFTAQNADPDIAISNRLRVLARVPVTGEVLEVVSVSKASDVKNESLAQVVADQVAQQTYYYYNGTQPQSNNGTQPQTQSSSMPVENRPPVYYYKGSDKPSTGYIPYSSGAGLAQKPEVVQRYAQKIQATNGNIDNDTAMKIAFHLLDKSERYGVDPRLVMALVTRESRFNPNAVSPVGAQGLGQLMPGTSSGMGVSKPFDIEQNLDGTVRYLRGQLESFRDVSLALAAYNAGPGNVRRFGGVPPFNETQTYVRVIWQSYSNMSSELVN